jgi:single-strand DNA-binding protein
VSTTSGQERLCVRRSPTIQGRNSGWFLRPGTLLSGPLLVLTWDTLLIQPTLSRPSDSAARSLSDSSQITGGCNAKKRKQSHPRWNVGENPEVRYSASGTPVASFSLDTNERFKDRNDGWQEGTEWHSIVTAFGGDRWEVRCQRLQGIRRRQGSRPQAGRIGRAGRGNTATEIVARDLLLLGPRENSGGDWQRPAHNQNEDQPSHAGSGEIVDEDIPF